MKDELRQHRREKEILLRASVKFFGNALSENLEKLARRRSGSIVYFLVMI